MTGPDAPGPPPSTNPKAPPGIQRVDRSLVIDDVVEAWFAVCSGLPVAAISIDRNGLVTRWNRHAEALYGWTAEEAMGKRLRLLIVPASRLAESNEVMGSMTESGHWEGTFECQRADGHTLPVHVLTIPQFDESGAFDGALGLSFDVSRAAGDQADDAAQIRQLAYATEHVRELDRQRIARELHDDLGQSLSALATDMAWLSGRLVEDEVLHRIDAMTSLVGSLLDTVRRVCSDLRPPILDQVGLASAVEWNARRFTDHTGIPCTVAFPVSFDELDGETSTELYRLVQEAMTNIERHAGASEASVICSTEGSTTVLTIWDDGSGLGPGTVEGFGIRSMRERAHRLGGMLTIDSASGAGTRLTIQMPTVMALPDRRRRRT